ncbi:MAG: glycerol-3-phosphate 1-O-acyltransferase PlsY [Proteobacteria bacterium]|jgi:glycerol-3-phosphate acyltransferase PlsY|nr:glycerol-3-phosphate 1-O-acyltransferase PlsY [Pseudomonadota bacterium]
MIISILIAYMLGSIPFGKIITKLLTGEDITKTGSKNIGATNVYRTVSKKAGLLVLLLDGIKPIIAQVIIYYFFTQFYQNYKFLYFLVSIIGHIFPIWLMFKGGKGVACFFGGYLIITPIPTLIAMAVWLLTVKITKTSSLGALISIFLLTIYQIVSNYGSLNKITIFTIMLLIFWKHTENIKRLIQGKENKINL